MFQARFTVHATRDRDPRSQPPVDIDGRARYVVNMHGLLTQTDEDDLLARRDDAAKQTIARAYVPMIRRIARGIGVPSMRAGDALGEGTLALYAALRSYDPSRNRPFASYAQVAVRRALALWWARELLVERRSTVSLDEPSAVDSERGTLHDVVPDPRAIDSERSALCERAQLACDDLRPARRRAVVEYALQGKTFAEIGPTRQAAEKNYRAGIDDLRTVLG